VWADSACRSEANEAFLAEAGNMKHRSWLDRQAELA